MSRLSYILTVSALNKNRYPIMTGITEILLGMIAAFPTEEICLRLAKTSTATLPGGFRSRRQSSLNENFTSRIFLAMSTSVSSLAVHQSIILYCLLLCLLFCLLSCLLFCIHIDTHRCTQTHTHIHTYHTQKWYWLKKTP